MTYILNNKKIQDFWNRWNHWEWEMKTSENRWVGEMRREIRGSLIKNQQQKAGFKKYSHSSLSSAQHHLGQRNYYRKGQNGRSRLSRIETPVHNNFCFRCLIPFIHSFANTFRRLLSSLSLSPIWFLNLTKNWKKKKYTRRFCHEVSVPPNPSLPPSSAVFSVRRLFACLCVYVAVTCCQQLTDGLPVQTPNNTNKSWQARATVLIVARYSISLLAPLIAATVSSFEKRAGQPPCEHKIVDDIYPAAGQPFSQRHRIYVRCFCYVYSESTEDVAVGRIQSHPQFRRSGKYLVYTVLVVFIQPLRPFYPFDSWIRIKFKFEFENHSDQLHLLPLVTKIFIWFFHLMLKSFISSIFHFCLHLRTSSKFCQNLSRFASKVLPSSSNQNVFSSSPDSFYESRAHYSSCFCHT